MSALNVSRTLILIQEFQGLTRLFSTTLMGMLAVLMLSGCAGRDRQPIYVQSDEVAPIRAPSGLDEPRVRPTFQVGGVFLPEMAGQHDTRPPRVLPSAEAERSRSHIRFGPRGLFLEVEDEADSVWRRLGFSLNRGGMQVSEVREDKNQYAFQFTDDPLLIDRTGLSRLAFWRSPERVDHSGDFLVEVEPVNERVTRVLLMDDAGKLLEMNRAEHVLAVLRERLG
jgi:uncharacterized lipoprotein